MSLTGCDKGVVLLSGGLDSSTLLYLLKKDLPEGELLAVSFRYGQKHSRELESAKAVAASAGVPHVIAEINLGHSGDFPWLTSALTNEDWQIPKGKGVSQQSQTVVPLRNPLLLILASQLFLSWYSKKHGVAASAITNWFAAFGAHWDDHYAYPDCRPEFYFYFQSAFKAGTDNCGTVIAPFIFRSKSEIARMAKELGVPIELTWSCYVGGEAPCGECPSCLARAAALADIGAA